jgi:hypothetical protein
VRLCLQVLDLLPIELRRNVIQAGRFGALYSLGNAFCCLVGLRRQRDN